MSLSPQGQEIFLKYDIKRQINFAKLKFETLVNLRTPQTEKANPQAGADNCKDIFNVFQINQKDNNF